MLKMYNIKNYNIFFLFMFITKNAYKGKCQKLRSIFKYCLDKKEPQDLHFTTYKFV